MNIFETLFLGAGVSIKVGFVSERFAANEKLTCWRWFGGVNSDAIAILKVMDLYRLGITWLPPPFFKARFHWARFSLNRESVVNVRVF